MQQLQHQTRTFPTRPSAFAIKWRTAANAGLVLAAFLFVGAVTLGLFP